LEVESVRQRCVSCDLTFIYDFELGLHRGSTAYFRDQIVKRCHGCPLTQVADEYGIPYTTLERWFYDHTSAEMDHQIQTVKHICIDEFALRKGHDYAMAALDADTGQVLHLEPGRDQTAVENPCEWSVQKFTPSSVILRRLWPRPWHPSHPSLIMCWIAFT
jgi:transposase